MQLRLLKVYRPIWDWGERYVQLIGGYGSGKSFHAVALMLTKMVSNRNVHFLMVRNTIKAVAESIWDEAKHVAEVGGISHHFKFLKNPYRILCPRTSSRATAFGCMEGSNSEFGSLTKGKKGVAEITDAIIDEADEIPEYFFDLIDGRCRSSISGQPNQIILCYNPPIKQNWIPQRWFKKGSFMPEFKSPYIFENKSFDARTKKEIISKTLVIRTNYLHNKHLPPQTAAIYEGYKKTNYDMYLAGVKAEWGSKFRGVYFSPSGYKEGVIPDDIRGVIYCDPNLAKKGKGDTTAIVKAGTDHDFIYIKDVFVKNTTKGSDLAHQITLMQDDDFRYIGFDGNMGQEGMWSEIIALSGYEKELISNIEYKKYHTNELVKTAQYLWDSGKIIFPVGFKDTLMGEAFLEQLYAFAGKTNTKKNQHDDAPDALCCAIQFLFEKGITFMRNII